jgi:hypothetical protein
MGLVLAGIGDSEQRTVKSEQWLRNGTQSSDRVVKY